MSDPLVSQASEAFVKAFGYEPEVVTYAPGRVNLIGEHTDYNDGFVCPFAIELHTIVVGRKCTGDMCKVVTTQSECSPSEEVFYGDNRLFPESEAKWVNYVKGVVAAYRKEFKIPSISFELAIASNVPMGGGLSSSASLEVAVGAFLESIYELPVDAVKRALLCQQAEHEYAHVQCGIMDQFISSCGKKGHALLIDCRSKETTDVPLNDPNIALIICNSNKKHSLCDGGYGRRVQECAEAAAAMQQMNASVKKLRDAKIEDLMAVKDKLKPEVYKRALHGITEDLRTQSCVELLKQNDLKKAGELMYQSHESLSQNYEVSTPELDALVSIAKTLPGVYGSRMTGGGFGGCTVTLCEASKKDEIMAELQRQYKQMTGIECTIFCTVAGKGAHVVSRSGPCSCGDASCKLCSCGKTCKPCGGCCNKGKGKCSRGKGVKGSCPGDKERRKWLVIGGIATVVALTALYLMKKH